MKQDVIDFFKDGSLEACSEAAGHFLVRCVATRFAEKLKQYLDPAAWVEMRRANRDEQDPGICHSHDECDANVFMDQALRDFGFGPVLDQDGFDPTNYEASTLWNEAWNYAKEHFLTAGRRSA